MGGLFPNVQFSVTLPTSYAVSDGKSHMSFGDGEIALKYRFLSETPTRPQVSFYPSVSVATGSNRYDLGSGHATLFLPVWAQKTSGKFTVFGGGGVLFDSSVTSGHTWSAGVAVTRDVSETTNLGIEIFHTGRQLDEPATTDIGIGVIRDVGQFHALLFSAGSSLTDSVVHVYGAYEWRLGPAHS